MAYLPHFSRGVVLLQADICYCGCLGERCLATRILWARLAIGITEEHRETRFEHHLTGAVGCLQETNSTACGLSSPYSEDSTVLSTTNLPSLSVALPLWKRTGDSSTTSLSRRGFPGGTETFHGLLSRVCSVRLTRLARLFLVSQSCLIACHCVAGSIKISFETLCCLSIMAQVGMLP